MKNTKFSNTMFIIGAGAHVPYNYPTAQKLTGLLKSLHRDCSKVSSISDGFLRSDSLSKLEKDKIKICRYLRDLKLVVKPEKMNSINAYDIKLGQILEHFLIEFGQSQVYSIDAYLANYLKTNKGLNDEAFPRIGKLLISYFIYDYEKQTPIGFHNFDWIQYIINRYLKDTKTLDLFLSEPPLIYTFNYDNHFEKCLCSHLVSYHGFEKDDAINKVNGLGIKHIYGHIDSLNNESEQSILESSIQNLRVVGEERSTDDLNEVSKSLAKSIFHVDDVYFLGFGFDELNTKLIFKHCPVNLDRSDYPNFYSTNIGFSPYNQRKANELCRGRVSFFPDREVDCLELLSSIKPIF